MTTDNEGEPGVVVADWGDAKLVACCDEVERPVTFGFEGNFGSGTPNPLSIGLAKLCAGERAARAVSHCGSADPTPTRLGWPGTFTSNLPKSIPTSSTGPTGGRLAPVLCRSASKWTTNPRGWFNDEKLDVTTPLGRRVFRDRLIKYAKGSIAVLKDVGARA